MWDFEDMVFSRKLRVSTFHIKLFTFLAGFLLLATAIPFCEEAAQAQPQGQEQVGTQPQGSEFRSPASSAVITEGLGNSGMGEATTATPQQVSPVSSFGDNLYKMLPLFPAIYLIFYMLVTKPQQQKLKEHVVLMEELKKGDQVVTTGGLIGRIVSKDKDQIVLDIGPNMKVKIDPAAVSKRWNAVKGDGEKTKGESDRSEVRAG